MKNPAKNSIRIQLLLSLLMPLLILWAICLAVAYFLAVGFANDAYDRELINSADSVAARLKMREDKIVVDLPPAAQAILHYNKRERLYYQVLSSDGTRLSGDAVLPGPVLHPENPGPVLRYSTLNGQALRIARIRVQLPNESDRTVIVQVAETLNSRRQLAQQILLAIVVPQVALICLGAIAIWLGITRSLLPLRNITDALDARSKFDLASISEDAAPTEVRPLVRAINDLLVRLQSDIESQKRFVANSAHQFRTPLAALKTYIYNAKRLPADKEMNAVLDKIDASTQRMSHLSNKLLALAKAEPANNFDDYRPIDLNYIASEATANFIPEAMKKNIEVSFVGFALPAVVRGDANNLAELTANLIENAILYTEPGGTVIIRVLCDDQVKLLVHDTGPGIPEEERMHVFERFYRVLGTNVPGSGLGLPIVREIASAHGARVLVTDGLDGIGTTVTVCFPDHNNGKKVH